MIEILYYPWCFYLMSGLPWFPVWESLVPSVFLRSQISDIIFISLHWIGWIAAIFCQGPLFQTTNFHVTFLLKEPSSVPSCHTKFLILWPYSTTLWNWEFYLTCIFGWSTPWIETITLLFRPTSWTSFHTWLYKGRMS